MPNTHLAHAIDDIAAAIPEHECGLDEECEYPEGFVLTAFALPDGHGEGDFVTHRMSLAGIFANFLHMMDDAAMNSRPTGMPRAIAVASVREMMRRALDSISLPGDVLAEIADLTTPKPDDE